MAHDLRVIVELFVLNDALIQYTKNAKNVLSSGEIK